MMMRDFWPADALVSIGTIQICLSRGTKRARDGFAYNFKADI